MLNWYCTIEDVTGALDFKTTPRDTAQVRRAIANASRAVDDACDRPEGAFRPATATRYFDWPTEQTAPRWRLWLDAVHLISVSALTSGGVTIGASDYFLEPQRYGPPYNRIEIDRGGSASFDYTDDTSQRAVAVTGLWGACADDRASAGTLDGSINASVASLTVSDGSAVGIGDHLIIGTERLEVTARTWTDSGQNLGGDLGALASATSVPVGTGSEYTAGELIAIDAERMRITDVIGNNLTVERAQDGTVLAAHTTGADIYAYRGCTVTRGAAGSMASSHTDGDTIERHVVPGDVWAATVGGALATILQEQAGYSRAPGQGQNAMLPAGRDLPTLLAQVEAAHGRIRVRVV